MPTGHAIQPSPLSAVKLPAPGTTAGNAARQYFIATLGEICGDGRSLFLPVRTNTTTSTSAWRDARVFTHDATIASRLVTLGSGVGVTFNGTSGEADTPDTANLSFGDGTVDEAFSIFGWVNQTATTGIKAIFSKYDAAGTLREYQMVLDAAEKLRFRLYDESADTYIGRLYNTALATASTIFVVGTYDGSRANTGVRLYAWDGTAAGLVDDTNDASGTYVAMENTATVGRLYSSGSGTPVEYFSGTGYGVGVCAKVLTLDDIWAAKAAGNKYYGLSL